MVSIVLVLPFSSAATTEIIMEPPYADSGVGNACGVKTHNMCAPSPVTAADHNTGVLSAAAVSAGLCGLSYCGAGSWARIEAAHELAAPASSVDYEVAVDVAKAARVFRELELSAWASHFDCCRSRVERQLTVSDSGTSTTLRLTLADPEGDIPAGKIRIGLELWALTGSMFVGLADLSEAQVRIASISAKVHHTGDPDPTKMVLTAAGYKVKGLQKADLTWRGATTNYVDIYRDVALIATTVNDGFDTDHIDQRGKGTYTYRVCESGTSTCSNEAVVEF